MKFGLTQKKKRRNKADRLEQPKAWAEKLLDIAEGGSGMLHNTTVPTLWRGRARTIEDVRRRCASFEENGREKVIVEGALAGGLAGASDGRQAVGKTERCKNRRKHSTHESGVLKREQQTVLVQGNPWNRWPSTQSVAGISDGKVWESRDCVGKSGAMRLLANAGQHVSLLSYFEECHERKADCVVAYA